MNIVHYWLTYKNHFQLNIMIFGTLNIELHTEKKWKPQQCQYSIYVVFFTYSKCSTENENRLNNMFNYVNR